MNTIMQPPAARDLPARRQLEMRAQVMRAIRGDAAPAPRRRRLAIAGAACALTAGVATLLAVDPFGGNNSQFLAYGGGAVPPEVQRAADRCLIDNAQAKADQKPISGDLSLVNFLMRHDRVEVVFAARDGMVYCSSGGGGRSLIRPTPGDWLPGPVKMESASSQTLEGTSDVFTMAGRVSPRVGKVVLQHGNGRVTQANLAGGTFTIINDGPVEVERLVLVTYDRSGRVIDRRRPWPLPQADSCYTDPTGKVVVGDASSGDCKPAEAWR